MISSESSAIATKVAPATQSTSHHTALSNAIISATMAAAQAAMSRDDPSLVLIGII